ncbi:heme uptake protein IsdC [Paenibacillus naphthalenovorans]|uniref:heme uptake protein IsdC n=1 Tax=Paenibacillus naphthalenovorans TaxID=162209 RepID=UPI000783B584|nr:heme uptake protein IsdC [Paenibacillus naphthalenovorans]
MEDINVKRFFAAPFLALSLVLAFALLVLPQTAGAAPSLSDGTYTIDYVITKAENDSVSMANDYFEKPAILTVKNGTVTAQIQMNHSKWITVFKTPVNDSFVDAKVVGSDSAADKRTVEFVVDDLSKPLISKIHVTVESIDYDHDYTIRFIFDEKSIKSVGTGKDAAPAEVSGQAKSGTSAASVRSSDAAAVSGKSQPATRHKSDAATADASAGKQTVENPQTGDTAPIAGLVVLLLISSAFVMVRIKSAF